MRPRNINLHIEELVLHNFAPSDRYTIADAVEHELSRLLAVDFADPTLPPALSRTAHRPRVDAGKVQVAPGAKADSIGVQIARSVHGGIANEFARNQRGASGRGIIG